MYPQTQDAQITLHYRSNTRRQTRREKLPALFCILAAAVAFAFGAVFLYNFLGPAPYEPEETWQEEKPVVFSIPPKATEATKGSEANLLLLGYS